MMPLAACAVILAASVPVQSEEKPKYPPYVVVIRAKTRFLSGKKSVDFHARVRAINVYARQAGRQAVDGDNAGWEIWTFNIAGENKLDIGIIQRAFADIQLGKAELSITGTAEQDPKTKVIVVTSYGGKVKVKLMNPRKNEGSPDQEVPDEVGKVSAQIAEGKQYFTVRGEIFSHGGTLAILLSSFTAASPPPPEKK